MALVHEAFDTLFNKRDYPRAERYWSPDYIQHSAHIAPGREGLFNLIKGIPPTLKYEPGVIAAEGDFVIVAIHRSWRDMVGGNGGSVNFSYLAFCLPELDLSVVTRYQSVDCDWKAMLATCGFCWLCQS